MESSAGVINFSKAKLKLYIQYRFKVNDIRVAEAPKEDKFEKAILKKHGDDWKKKVLPLQYWYTNFMYVQYA